MFKRIGNAIKTRAVSISLTVGALIAAAVGATYLFPHQVASGLAATGNFFGRLANGFVGLFRRGSESVANIQPVVDQQAPVTEVVMAPIPA